MRHRLELIALLLLAVTPAAMATEYSLANGHVRFRAPDGWPRIMQTQGDPESMVFQLRDPSPTSHDTLARISVTSKRVRDLAAFQHFVSEDMNRARALPDFQADPLHSGPTRLHYTATESGEAQTYVERYYFKDGYAVQLRCVRPSHSQAGADWTTTFDNGCASVAASLQ